MTLRQLPYYLDTSARTPERLTLYPREDLERMTVFQLRDICERERIIHANLERLGWDELIRLILRFRGDRKPLLIRRPVEGGRERLEEGLRAAKKNFLPGKTGAPAKLIVYEGLDTTFLDNYALGYRAELDGVNALVVDSGDNIRCVLNVEPWPGGEGLYLTRGGSLPAAAAQTKDCRLWLFPREDSDKLFALYQGKGDAPPTTISLWSEPLTDYSVRQPVEAPMPLAVDFGTTNTTAGAYVDGTFYAEIEEGVRLSGVKGNAAYYARFLDAKGAPSHILPTMIGVNRIEDGQVLYNVGFAAERMAREGYLGAGFSVFRDIKRWVSDYEREEELTDFEGRRAFVPRKEILREFILYVIARTQEQLKCRFSSVYLSFPVKQKGRFLALYREILPETLILGEGALDEGVAVLYNLASGMVGEKSFEDGKAYKALVIDCGGGTTDLASCRFSIRNKRVAYEIDMETAYENGDTDFGGNNLTYRLTQLLKIGAARRLTGQGATVREALADLGGDAFRSADRRGDAVYDGLERAYREAERVIPTRFKEYEFAGREEYYMVKNNYYYLFALAEDAKKLFFGDERAARVLVASAAAGQVDDGTAWVDARRWRLAAYRRERLSALKEFPSVMLSAAEARDALRADIYLVLRRFLLGLYESGELGGFDIIKLAGQSCAMDLFTESITQFVPGLMLRREGESGGGRQLKLACLDGALRFLGEGRLGYAKANVLSKLPALPYELFAYTHAGERVVLVAGLDRRRLSGGISRRAESGELRLHLSDARGVEKHVYTARCEGKSFRATTYDELAARFGPVIRQDEVDIVEDGETRYFVWADGDEWGFSVLPVTRWGETLRVGERQFFQFESGGWTRDNFDGLR
jgi:hypothetical protein